MLRATGEQTTFLALMEVHDPEGSASLADVALADRTVWALTDAAFDALGDALDALPSDELKRILGHHISPPRRSPTGAYDIVTPEFLFAEAGSVFAIDAVITEVAAPSLPARVGYRLVRALLYDDVRFVIWPTIGATVVGPFIGAAVRRRRRRRPTA